MGYAFDCFLFTVFLFSPLFQTNPISSFTSLAERFLFRPPNWAVNLQVYFTFHSRNKKNVSTEIVEKKARTPTNFFIP